MAWKAVDVDPASQEAYLLAAQGDLMPPPPPPGFEGKKG